MTPSGSKVLDRTWLALTIVPFVAALAWSLHQHWAPGLDRGLLELQVLDVGTRQTPLVGAYSRFGWDHPGPWQLWLMAGPYQLLGTSHGLLAAATVLNATSVAGVVAVTRRFLPRAVARTAIVVMCVVLAGLSTALADPWNPYLSILPAVLAVLGAALVHRHPALAPVVIVAAAVAVQGHLGFVLLGGVATLQAIVAVIRSERAPRLVAATAGALVLMWAPVAGQQLTADPGNLTLLLEDRLDPPASLELDGRPTAGIGGRDAAAAVVRQVGPSGTWTRMGRIGNDELGTSGISFGVLVLSAFGALVVLRRRTSAACRHLQLSAGLYLGVAIVSTLQIRGIPWGYLFGFFTPTMVLLVLSMVWSTAELAGPAVQSLDRTRKLPRVVEFGGLAAGLALVVLAASSFVGATPPETRISEVGLTLAPPVVDYLADHDIDHVAVEPERGWEATSLTVVLRRRGVEVGDDSCVIRVRRVGEARGPREVVLASWRPDGPDRAPGPDDLHRFFENRHPVDATVEPSRCVRGSSGTDGR